MHTLKFIGLVVLVSIVHLFILKEQIEKKTSIPKAKKVYKIQLSSVSIKKPPIITPPPKKIIKHIVPPIILPPDEPKPKKIVKKIVKKRKSIVKKVTRKRKIRKKPLKKIVQKPIIEPVVEPISQPVFTQPQPTIKQSTIDTTTIKNRYQNRVRKKIKNSLIYPRIAKKLRLQGVVNVAFTILKNGQVTSIKIISSPKAILSKGAKKTLKNIIFDSIPDELNLDQMNLSIPIEFKLKG